MTASATCIWSDKPVRESRLFLENLALQDMLNGDGFAFIDPHGDVAERLLSMVPKERTEDIIYFSPADMAYAIGFESVRV